MRRERDVGGAHCRRRECVRGRWCREEALGNFIVKIFDYFKVRLYSLRFGIVKPLEEVVRPRSDRCRKLLGFLGAIWLGKGQLVSIDSLSSSAKTLHEHRSCHYSGSYITRMEEARLLDKVKLVFQVSC